MKGQIERSRLVKELEPLDKTWKEWVSAREVSWPSKI